MAHWSTRLRWLFRHRMSVLVKNDIFLVLLVLGVLAIISYVVILHHEAPDGTVIDLSQAKQMQIIQELQNEPPASINHQQKTKHEESLIYSNRKENPEPPEDTKLQLPAHIEEMALKEANKVTIKPKQWMKQNREKLKDMLNPKESNVNVDVPVEGELKGGKGHCSVYNTHDPVNESFECVRLNVKLKPKPKVCLYPDKVDVHLSRKIREDGIWEPHMVKLFMDILEKDDELGVIDIGANIGVYSLVAAASGHKVVAVEPFEENLLHLAKGIQLTGVHDQMTVVQNAISDKRREYMNLVPDETNQGGLRLDDSNHNMICMGDDCLPQVQTILMDDLLEVINFKRAIIKIDIEGHEHRAFREAKQLFKQVFISHIIMEWIKMKEHYHTMEEVTKDKILVHELLNMLKEEGFKAYSMVTGQEQDPAVWYAWPDDVIWVNELADLLNANIQGNR